MMTPRTRLVLLSLVWPISFLASFALLYIVGIAIHSTDSFDKAALLFIMLLCVILQIASLIVAWTQWIRNRASYAWKLVALGPCLLAVQYTAFRIAMLYWNMHSA